MRRAIILSLILFLVWPVQAQEKLVVPQSGESLGQLGLRLIPNGKKLMHPVVKGDFGPTKGNIVILFGGKEERGFLGWVLVPERDRYKMLTLPGREFPVSTEIRAAFFASAGDDKPRELFVLCNHISGVGRYPGNVTPFYMTYVYSLDGSNIKLDEDTEYDLNHNGELRTKHQVLHKLRELTY